ncbi:MAG: hypothetical protein IJ637_00170 [Prevotella sp.]|nr:hypothetical protein [Prevotella sp.]
MNKSHLYPKLLGALLWLLCAQGVHAQAGLEYWFDSYTNPQRISMPAAAGHMTGNINANHLSQGLHTIYMRAVNGRDYSPVTSSTFIKFATGEGNTLEYWFDSDTEHIATMSIDVKDGESQVLELDLSDVERFPLGVHQLNMRVATDGGRYSAVYSDFVVRLQAGTGESELEYWFDDSYENHSVVAVSTEQNEVQKLELDMSDVARFPYGVHQLNMRIAQLGSRYSPIYTANVLRLQAGAGESVLEYWFDDDIEHRATKAVSAEGGQVQTLELDLSDDSSFPYGLHRLNMRIAVGGTRFSPVYTSVVMRHRQGPRNYLTYWLDDDYANRQRVWTSTGNGHQFVFSSRLDFSRVAEGMHRLKMRIATNETDDGVVYEYPVLVVRRYQKSDNVVVKSDATWMNDNSVKAKDLANPKSLLTKQYVLDPETFEPDRQYAFHVQYINSAQVWSSINTTYFYRDATTGTLRAGRVLQDDGEVTVIDVTPADEQALCYYSQGAIHVDMQSARLAPTGIVAVYDLTGKPVARQQVASSDGSLHAEVAVPGMSPQMLIVRVSSGAVSLTRKLVCR